MGHHNQFSAARTSQRVAHPAGFIMPYLLSLVQVVLLSVLLFQYTATFPSGDRYKRSNLKARQLGDLEFTSRQAELLKSKAKLSSLCSFLRRMQNSKKSGLTGDTEHVNTLMKQYMCASVYQ
ncbi:uncharacterized protein LOC119893589 [Tachysurus ichikawai]